MRAVTISRPCWPMRLGSVALAAARRDAVTADGWIRLAVLTEPVQRVLEIVGLDTIIACHPTLAQALTP